jgi:hypothetical protein
MSEKKKPKLWGVAILILAFLIQNYLYFINPLDKNWLPISWVWCLLFPASGFVPLLISRIRKSPNAWVYFFVLWTIVYGILYFFVL